MKALKYLSIKHINFAENVKIKLSNLKKLIIENCKNLDLSDIICPKLEKLYFYREDEPNLNYFKGIDKKFKNLKELYTSYNLREFNYNPKNVLESVKEIDN